MEIRVRTEQVQRISNKTAKGTWDIWWRLIRPHTLTASFVPVSIGTALALPFGGFQFSLFFIMLLASLIIQAATNMFNEYYDYKQGLDTAQSVGIGGTIVRDGIKPRTVLIIALSAMGVAFLLGLSLCVMVSWWLMPVGLFCAAMAYLYSGGPYPISSTPFGEVVSGLCMGLIIISIAFFIQTGLVTTEVILVSIPSSILIGAILMANNIRDLDPDKLHGRRTLAILLGRNSAVLFLQAMFILSYLWVLALILSGVIGSWAALSLLSLPKATQAVRGFRASSAPEALMPAMVATAQTNTVFGLFLALGLLLEYVLR